MEFIHLGLGSSLRDYVETWELQRELHARVVAGAAPDTVLLLEHADVLTAGKRTNAADRPTDGTPVVDVDRGGKITWHGPGQLVVYPIVRLAEPIDVVQYVRALECAVMGLLTEFELRTEQVPGNSGVWVLGSPNRKIAAIGVRVAQGVTMHGVAINVNPDLRSFTNFTPCGLPDVGVTSLRVETGRALSPADVADAFRLHLAAALQSLLPSSGLAGSDQTHVQGLEPSPSVSSLIA